MATETVGADSRVIYLFSGQGSQVREMGRDLFEESVAARCVFEEIQDVIDLRLLDIMFHGTEEQLTPTKIAQPAILAFCLAAYAALEEAGGKFRVPSIVAGHSLGEYTALVIAGAITVTDAARLVVERGRLMQEACDEKPGGMWALLGIDEQAVQEICEQAGTFLANVNSNTDGKQQIIISGEHPLLVRAIDLAAARGATKCIQLSVGGAFHSGLMESAQAGLMDWIESLEINDPLMPVIANRNGQPLETEKAIRNELTSQITACVQWDPSIRYMLNQEMSGFVEVGPKRVLTGMLRRTYPKVRTQNVTNMPDVLALAS